MDAGVTAVNTLDMRNNIIQGFNNGGLRMPNIATTGAVIDYNLYFGNSGPAVASWKAATYATTAAFFAAQAFEQHGQAGDPGFTDVTVSPPNLRIQTGSAAMDVGVDLSATFTTDMDGDPRPYGPAWDIGADEYRAAGTPLAAPTLIEVVPVAP